MEIKVLGTSGSDTHGEHLTSFLLDGTILFDAGGITGSLRLKQQHRIRYIFITHAHLDHIRDIPFLAENLVVGGKESWITVFSIDEVIDDIKKHLFNHRIWPDFTVIPDEKTPVIRFEKIKGSVRLNNLCITPFSVNHTVPATGYLVQKGNKSFFYTGDTGPSEKTWKNLANIHLDALIIETSFPDKMKKIAQTTGHLTPELLFQELSRIGTIPDKIYITHVKSFFRKQIEKEIQKRSS
ncbi:MAG: 3',5'-cyclic-nucleotide phosphodiesterase, partial [Candidatus Omnitrophica bacterium]|nr:3',5'-cyclic-nucleotide phosphodiesterase [Candidatus Omnitrophota bacterium]